MALRVFVDCPSVGAPISVDVNADATVGDLQKAVCEAANLPQTRLFFQDKELSDPQETLADCSVSSQSRLSAVMKHDPIKLHAHANSFGPISLHSVRLPMAVTAIQMTTTILPPWRASLPAHLEPYPTVVVELCRSKAGNDAALESESESESGEAVVLRVKLSPAVERNDAALAYLCQESRVGDRFYFQVKTNLHKYIRSRGFFTQKYIRSSHEWRCTIFFANEDGSSAALFGEERSKKSAKKAAKKSTKASKAKKSKASKAKKSKKASKAKKLKTSKAKTSARKRTSEAKKASAKK